MTRPAEAGLIVVRLDAMDHIEFALCVRERLGTKTAQGHCHEDKAASAERPELPHGPATCEREEEESCRQQDDQRCTDHGKEYTSEAAARGDSKTRRNRQQRAQSA